LTYPVIIEDLLLNAAGKTIKLMGGFVDPNFTTQTGYTTIKGKLTIGQGSLVVDRVIIK